LSSHYEKFLATGEVKCIDDEIPFEIPEGWEWIRLSSIVSILGDGIHGTPEYDDTGDIFFVNGNNLNNGKIIIKADTKRLNRTEANKHRRALDKNTILVSINGTIGNIAFYNNENIILGKSACYFNILGNIDKDYIKLIIESDYFISYAKSVATGSTIKNVPLNGMRNFLVPLPPIKEQTRIVSKMSDLSVCINNYSRLQKEVNRLNHKIFTQFERSILQEAIQGKLVPQDPNDEPASVLLERIREEKQLLLKEGKLKKKDITDSIIFQGEDNKYYEQIGSEVYEIETEMQFPATWELVRLGDICRLVDAEKRSGAYPCLDAKYLRGKSSATILQTGKFVQAGDNLILVDGENSGEVFSVPVDGYMGSTFKQLWISSELHLPYVLHFILFYKEQLRNSKKGAAIPHLNKEIFYNLLVGIPPLKEQYRISESVANLLSKLS